MEESILYISQGKEDDKQSAESFAVATSIRTSQQHASFRNADAVPNGAALTGFGPGERLFAASPNKALLSVYTWGKESADQRFPVPEQLSCVALCAHPISSHTVKNSDYRMPWLLAAGGRSGKLYVWELASGNLVAVREGHYQAISCLRFSQCGSYLVSGGSDARVLVWKTAELVAYDEEASPKPRALADHTLGVTAVDISVSANPKDIRMTSASLDGTIRMYDLFSGETLSTFVLPHPVECVARDPANRALYAGLANGHIRQIPLYAPNKNTRVVESIGGLGRIVTLDADHELAYTFVHHGPERVTQIAVSFDGMNIVSGDSRGRVFVSDVVTKQTIKTLTPCSGPISYLQVAVCGDISPVAHKPKNHRLLPPFKRVLRPENPQEHTVYIQIPEGEAEEKDWVEGLAEEEFAFKNLATVQTEVRVVDTDVQGKLERVSRAYEELKRRYEEVVDREQ